MIPSESLKSDRLSDWIVIPAAAAVTAVVSLGIFAVSFSLEAGIGWIIAVFVLFFVVQRIDRTKAYGSSIRVGMALGIGVSYIVVRFFWL